MQILSKHKTVYILKTDEALGKIYTFECKTSIDVPTLANSKIYCN